MAVTLLTPETRDQFVNRFMKIESETKPNWGKMNAAQLMRHIRYALDTSTGENPAEDKSNFFTRKAIKYLFFYAYTNWPKGKIKAPDHFTPEPTESFEEERHQMIKSLDRFLHSLKSTPDHKTVSEFLGPLTLREWSRVHGVHFEHHLRQFGV